MENIYDFSDIAPYSDDEFHEKLKSLVREPGFEHAVRYVVPDVNFPEFVEGLLKIHDKATFQAQIMQPFLEALCIKTTAGITYGGYDKVSDGGAYTYMSNHRDIVLDASFLNLGFLRRGMPSSEIAIGNNLLIYDWITDLVRLNKSFIVKRNLRLTKALEAAKQLSAYIHHAIVEKHESVWIAQREGRAKDSSDMTQESVVKMLGLEGGGSLIDNIMSLNIVPVSINYEYDPNDYLKAREFLLKKHDPEFKKSQRDDLFSMETGLLEYKGRVHFEVCDPINKSLEVLRTVTDKVEVVKRVCAIIDCEIHSNYKLYPLNYIAYDLLTGGNEYSSNYTDEDVASFRKYIDKQLDKVDVENVSADDRDYMVKMMLSMYANPLRNKQASLSSTCPKAEGELPVK